MWLDLQHIIMVALKLTACLLSCSSVIPLDACCLAIYGWLRTSAVLKLSACRLLSSAEVDLGHNQVNT